MVEASTVRGAPSHAPRANSATRAILGLRFIFNRRSDRTYGFLYPGFWELLCPNAAIPVDATVVR